MLPMTSKLSHSLRCGSLPCWSAGSDLATFQRGWDSKHRYQLWALQLSSGKELTVAWCSLWLTLMPKRADEPWKGVCPLGKAIMLENLETSLSWSFRAPMIEFRKMASIHHFITTPLECRRQTKGFKIGCTVGHTNLNPCYSFPQNGSHKTILVAGEKVALKHFAPNGTGPIYSA